jgi:hypothetical protein
MAARWTLAALLVLAFALPADAASTPPGVNLRWDNCFSDGGLANKDFACDTNSGSELLVASFELTAPLSQVDGQEAIIDLVSASPSLPAWWQLNYANIGTCRAFALSIQPHDSPGCPDWAPGLASLNIAAYQLGQRGPNTARLQILNAVRPEALQDLVAGQEYSAFQLSISHAKTVGLGACDGCGIPVCIFFQELKLTTYLDVSNLRLDTGANGPASQSLTWQEGALTNIIRTCGESIPNFPPSYRCRSTFGCVLASTPVRASRWGEVKALYR